MRWLLTFIGVWVICIGGFYIVWLVGLLINCTFMQDCLGRLGSRDLFEAVNGKSVFVKGTISAIAITFVVWSRRRVR